MNLFILLMTSFRPNNNTIEMKILSTFGYPNVYPALSQDHRFSLSCGNPHSLLDGNPFSPCQDNLLS